MTTAHTQSGLFASDDAALALHTQVLAVHRDRAHRFSKQRTDRIELLTGLGVEGDAHCGAQVQHRSRVAQDALQPNLRQVHLISESLLQHAAELGFPLVPGELGENITLAATPQLGWLEWVRMPRGTRLVFDDAVPNASTSTGRTAEGAVFPPPPMLELTGLRNPCWQIDAHRPGLLAAMLGRDARGKVLRKTGVMAVVLQGGTVTPGMRVQVFLPPPPHVAMERV